MISLDELINKLESLDIKVLRASMDSDIDGYTMRPLQSVESDLASLGIITTRRRETFIEGICLVDGKLIPVEIANTLLRGSAFKKARLQNDFINNYLAAPLTHDHTFRILKSLLCLRRVQDLGALPAHEIDAILVRHVMSNPYKRGCKNWNYHSSWRLLLGNATMPGLIDRIGTLLSNIAWHYRTTKMLALVGPDGSGKSTLIAALQEYDGFKAIYMGQKEFRAQRLIATLQKIPKISVPLVQIIFFFEYWGRFLQAQKLRLQGFDVVFDRYPTFDAVVSPSHFDRLLGATLYRFLFPRPDLMVELQVPVEQVRSRKAEMSADEIETFYRRAAEIPAIKIDNTKPVPFVTMQILRAFHESP